MTGAGLWNFFLTLVELVIVGAIIFAALEFIVTDERFKKIARLAIGGVLVLAFLFSVGAVFGFGGGGGAAFAISPVGLIFFAIGVIVLLVVWYLVLLGIDVIVRWFPPLAAWTDALKFVVSAGVLIVLLLLSADLLFGAGIMIHNQGGRPVLGRL